MEFRILGPLEISTHDGLIALTRPLERAVVVALVLHPGEVVASDRLLEYLWPDTPPEKAQHSLHVHVSRLRRLLGDELLVTERPGYRLTIGASQVDAFRFESLVQRSRGAWQSWDPAQTVRRLREALDLWRGQPLQELDNQVWVQPHIAHLEEVRLGAVEDLFEGELALGQHAQVAERAAREVETHPFRERVWGHLMLALYRSGRQADALAAYQRASRLLREELGIEPGPDLRRLEEAIVVQKPDLDWKAPSGETVIPHHLPAFQATFVGRDQELLEVDKLLRGSRLVTLVGPGGSGKSRLALETAGQVIERFPDGVWAVELASVGGGELVAGAVAEVLEIWERPGQHLADTLAAFLGARDLLIVLDNCEHVLDSVASLVGPLLTAAPKLRVLITSREPLRVIGETIYSVEPMSVPPTGENDPEMLARHDALRLFAARAEAIEPGFRLTEATTPAVADICRRVDGLPLGIELMAGRLRGMDLEELAEHLEDRATLLGSDVRTPDTRHRTLRAALEWSYDLLPTVEQEALRGIGVFHGSFDLPAFREVVMPEEGLDGAADILGRLVERSLISRDGKRWNVLETVLLYARERLEKAGELHAVRRRHLDHYIEVAERAEARIRAGDDLGALPVFTADYPNMRAALQYALNNRRNSELAWTALRMTGALYWFWIMRGQWSEALGWIRQGLEANPERPSVVRAKAVLALAGLAGQAGLYEEALEAAAHARAISLDEGFIYGASLASSIEGVNWAWKGDFERAQAVFDRWQGELTTGEDPMAEAMLLFNRGWALGLGGEIQEAERLLQKSKTLSRSHGFAFGTACGLLEMARLARLRTGHDRAEDMATEAIELLTTLRSGWWIGAQAFYDLGLIARSRGELDDAAKRFREGLDLASRYGNTLLTVDLLEAQAGVLLDGRRFEPAARLLGAAEHIRHEMGAPHPPSALAALQADSSAVRNALGDKRFQEAKTGGAGLALDEAVSEARRG